MAKVTTASEAAALIPSGATVMVDGSGGGVNEPDLVLKAIEERFLESGAPNNLTVVHPSGMGDRKGGGIERLAYPGMVRVVIGGHWGWSDRMQEMARNEEIEAYCLPQGVISQLMRAIAGGKPGVISQIGFGTFVDPRIEGGRLNRSAEQTLVKVIELEGREWLFYKSLPIDVAIIRGTVADELGNITMDEEGLFAETLSTAQAAKNSGGIVIAQVKRLAKARSLDPRRVKVPGVMVDAIVIHPTQALSCEITDEPALYGALQTPEQGIPLFPMTERKVIARRAVMELDKGDIINLGFGMPDGVAAVLAEEGKADAVTLTVEQGHIGGIPASGVNFGLARNQLATLDAGYQFDWYDGGGLDVAVLSFAQVDAIGNVNVSKFGGKMPGIGGFINISQGARRVVFVGTFTAGKPLFDFGAKGLQIMQDGSGRKFVDQVEQISFSANYARQWGRPVIYVTERAVFRLIEQGVMLTEIAPGVDMERDILSKMGFRPIISPQLKTMDARLFRTVAMGLDFGVVEEVNR